jgi:hypothetical protein
LWYGFFWSTVISGFSFSISISVISGFSSSGISSDISIWSDSIVNSVSSGFWTFVSIKISEIPGFSFSTVISVPGISKIVIETKVEKPEETELTIESDQIEISELIPEEEKPEITVEKEKPGISEIVNSIVNSVSSGFSTFVSITISEISGFSFSTVISVISGFSSISSDISIWTDSIVNCYWNKGWETRRNRINYWIW